MTPAKTQPTPINHRSAPAARVNNNAVRQTLLDHLQELRGRLFWVLLALIGAASLGWAAQKQIMAALMAPLGGQRLVYLTPIGGFNFIFKVSLYFGIGLALPVIIYHLYRFLEPVMGRHRKRSVVLYSLASLVLAVGGACFAYFASLPAALHFLTGINIKNVSAMLTVDSYLSFVVTYVLGFAVLFQIPLVLMIINTTKPIPPKKLLGFERYVILAAFIVGAIISPTPDVTNQTIMALPIIVMYQIGVVLIWLQSRGQQKHQAGKPAVARAQPRLVAPAGNPVAVRSQSRPVIATPIPQSAQRHVRPAMDITSPIRRGTAVRNIPRSVQPRQQYARRPQVSIRPRPQQNYRGSIDGFVIRTQPAN